jgi:peptidoglycan/xylan/chitin deacetylase (PgdA/CDA1 family)
MPLGLGVDFEHIYHTPAYRSLNGEPPISLDLNRVTKRILQLFDQYDIRATFFVVAELAEEHPELIRTISIAGHEIASHTVSHPSLPSLSTTEIRDEIRESKAVLHRIAETSVEGFRAPTCELDDRVYSALIEASYTYSSSAMPSVPIPGFYSDEFGFEIPTKIVTKGGQIVEQPLSTSPLVPFPISGAWTRLLGRRYLLTSVGRLLQDGAPVVTYVHPWEFTNMQDTPLPFRNRFRTGEWMFETYESLLSLEGTWMPVGDLVEEGYAEAKYVVPED